MEESATCFPGVLGHEAICGHLQRAIERGQLHHALVLAGPAGVGKETLARGLACALLCPEAKGRGCGRCPICVRVLARNHPDLSYLTPSGPGGLIKIEDARACLIRQASAPYEADAHVIIVDPADALGDKSGNALLKAIEEPRPGVHWLLLSQNLHGLLPTILSRALPIRMGRLPEPVVRQILSAQAPEVSEERRDMAALLAEGSAGEAVALARDPVLERCLELLRHALAAAARGPVGIFSGDHAPLWSSWSTAVEAAVAAHDAEDARAREAAAEPAVVKVDAKGKVKGKKGRAKAKKTTSKKAPAARQREVATRLVDLWTLHIRQRLRDRPGLPGVPAIERPPARLVRDLERLRELEAQVRGNANVRLVVEQTLLELGP
ncbi:MAG: hypothetical protein R3A51_02260 [Nannocystaceae bacterium]|nr:hypothetical protein [Myxococcales bacterium]